MHCRKLLFSQQITCALTSALPLLTNICCGVSAFPLLFYCWSLGSKTACVGDKAVLPRESPLSVLSLTDKRVFGVPLSVNVRRYGQALPKNILYAMKYLRETGVYVRVCVRERESVCVRVCERERECV